MRARSGAEDGAVRDPGPEGHDSDGEQEAAQQVDQDEPRDEFRGDGLDVDAGLGGGEWRHLHPGEERIEGAAEHDQCDRASRPALAPHGRES
jgi:hypothetical protein